MTSMLSTLWSKFGQNVRFSNDYRLSQNEVFIQNKGSNLFVCLVLIACAISANFVQSFIKLPNAMLCLIAANLAGLLKIVSLTGYATDLLDMPFSLLR